MTGSSGLQKLKRGLQGLGVRCAVVAFWVVAYRVAFWPLYGLVGSPAFLLGLLPCLIGAALLGLRGGLAAIAVVVLLDRGFALTLGGPEMSRTAGIIALLAKLVLAGGLGLVVDSRRRLGALNARLREEVDARARSEASLERSEELHRALVESLGEGVGLFDARDRVVFANQALASMLGISHNGLLGRRFAEFLVPESAEQTEGTYPAASETRSYEAVLRNNAARLLLVTETNFGQEDARDELTLRVVRDLTERIVSERRQRDLERELQRSQSLQSLAVMAGGVAHDFNNLLCGVVGNAEIAQRRMPAEASPLLSRCLSEIVTFADEAAQLSKQMLAYAGRHNLAIEAVNPNVELSAALRLLHATVESKARLVLDLGQTLPDVASDKFQLRQVVTNLVLNALEAMDGERGVLTLRSESLRLAADRAEHYGLDAGGYVKITVEDTGTGIPVDTRPRLFEPFFSTKAAGRGMGLAAAAGIVRAHRGWLGVETTSKQGTSFAILLPVARESTPRRTAPPRASSIPPAARNILLIDNEPAVRLVTGRLLSELGQRVTTAESGGHGLELFSAQPQAIDLVVLDLTMPDQSGEQVLEALRLVRDDIPVVITSGFRVAEASKLLGAPNVIGFLDKPHTLTKLEMVLASMEDPSAPSPRPSASEPHATPMPVRQ